MHAHTRMFHVVHVSSGSFPSRKQARVYLGRSLSIAVKKHFCNALRFLSAPYVTGGPCSPLRRLPSNLKDHISPATLLCRGNLAVRAAILWSKPTVRELSRRADLLSSSTQFGLTNADVFVRDYVKVPIANY